MEPTKEQIDAIYRERVLQARRMPPEEKLLAGPRLFEEECARMAQEIRDENPTADEACVRELLRQRLDRIRKLDELGIYYPVEEPTS